MPDQDQQPAPTDAAPQGASPATPNPAPDASVSPTPGPETPLFQEPKMEGVQAGLPPQKVMTLDEKPPPKDGR